MVMTELCGDGRFIQIEKFWMMRFAVTSLCILERKE